MAKAADDYSDKLGFDDTAPDELFDTEEPIIDDDSPSLNAVTSSNRARLERLREEQSLRKSIYDDLYGPED